MSKLIGIYKIQSITKPKRFYIGSSLNVIKRWVDHKSALRIGKHGAIFMQNHVNKYGLDDLDFILIEECNKENLIEREQYYLDTLSPKFNTRKIADNNIGVKRTKEQINKIIFNLTGRSVSKETRIKIGLANKGRKHTEETKLKLSIYGKQRKFSEETRLKISIAGKGRKFSKETVEKIAKHNRKPIIQYNINGEFIKEYIGLSEAARQNNMCFKNISCCARGVTKTAHGYIWKYRSNN